MRKGNLCVAPAAVGVEVFGEQEKEVSFVEPLTHNRCGGKKCLEGERENLNGEESYLPRRILGSFSKFTEQWSEGPIPSLYLLCAPKFAGRIT